MNTEEGVTSVMLTVDAAHSIIGKDSISRNCLYQAIKTGEIPSIRLGKRILIPRKRFMRFLAGEDSHAHK